MIFVQINNDISATSVSSEVDMEYMRGKEITYKVIYQPADSTTFSVTVTTPFEKFETMKYSVNWSGNPTSWTEATTTEFYYGKVSTYVLHYKYMNSQHVDSDRCRHNF